MGFDKMLVLFLDEKELTVEVIKALRIYGIDKEELIKNEGVFSIYITGKYIGLNFIFELEEALNKRITLCTRYIGSAETIKSLGLD